MKTKQFDHKNYEFNKGGDIGIYLIHGFSSTTYEMKLLAQFLGEQGFHVVANNLPGHGTDVEDCNKTNFHDWLDYSKIECAKLASQSNKLFIIGGSMGAVIGLYLASMFPVNGLILGGTVVKFQFNFMTNYFNTLFCWFIKKRAKKSIVAKQVKEKIKFYGYSEYPLIALNEFRKMLKFVKPHYKKVLSPTLIIHSENDRTSIKDNIDIVKNSIGSQKKTIFCVKKAHHNMFDTNPDQNIIFQKILNFLNNN